MIKDYNGNNPTNANATQTSNGLMSADDKTKLDNLGLSVDTLPIGSEVLIDSDKDIPEGWEEVEEVYSNPNLLINGDFQIDQRNIFDTTITVDYTYKYYIDRWMFYSNSSVNLHIYQGNSTEPSKSTTTGMTIVPETDVSSIGILQYLENKLKDGEYYTLSCSINGQIKYITFEKGSKRVTDGNLIYTPSTDRVSHDYIIIKTGAISAGETMTIDYIKLEPGTVATKHVPKINIEELLNCRRYYYRIIGDHKSSLLGGNIYSNTIYINIPTQVPMRISPTFKFSNLKAIMDGEISFGFMQSYTDFSYTTDTIHFVGKFEGSATGSRSGAYGRLLFTSDKGYISFDSEIYS